MDAQTTFADVVPVQENSSGMLLQEDPTTKTQLFNVLLPV